MPTYVFSCDEGHVLEKIRPTAYKRNPRVRCPKCGLFMRRNYVLENKGSRNHITHIDRNNEPISHLLNKRSTKGHWVENLTPKPVFVETQAQYQKLLHDTHSREARK